MSSSLSTRRAALLLFLDYIYTKKKPSGAAVSVETLCDLLLVADRFQLTLLVRHVSNMLESSLSTQLSAASLFRLLNVALAVFGEKDETLSLSTAEFIERHLLSTVETSNDDEDDDDTTWRNSAAEQLSCASLAWLLSRDTFCASESVVLDLAERWHLLPKRQNETCPRLAGAIRLHLLKPNVLDVLNDDTSFLIRLFAGRAGLERALETRGRDKKAARYSLFKLENNEVTSDCRAQVITGHACVECSFLDYEPQLFIRAADNDNNNAITVKIGNPVAFNRLELDFHGSK